MKAKGSPAKQRVKTSVGAHSSGARDIPLPDNLANCVFTLAILHYGMAPVAAFLPQSVRDTLEWK